MKKSDRNLRGRIMFRLWQRFWSAAKIADVFGVTAATVHYYLAIYRVLIMPVGVYKPRPQHVGISWTHSPRVTPAPEARPKARR